MFAHVAMRFIRIVDIRALPDMASLDSVLGEVAEKLRSAAQTERVVETAWKR
jgi:hypothetical protein